jgi:Protein of unknown function (DUF1592)/Protein of unknown function (DUF1588)/Protein of unknown function (DUF1595)/Protein of unknown function (DUF1587)
MKSRWSAAGLIVLAVASCTDEPLQLAGTRMGGASGTETGGTVGATGGTGGNADSRAFLCSDDPVPADNGWRRLTKKQYTNTLRDLFAWALGTNEASVVMDELAFEIGRYPEDTHSLEAGRAGYRRQNQVLQQDHVDSGFELAFVASRKLTQPMRLRAILGECADANENQPVAACVKRIVLRFTERAFRRPVGEADLADLLAMHPDAPGIDSKSVANIFAVVLGSPEFVYVVEHGAEGLPIQPAVFALSPFELAARLSYQFWDAPPDDELLGLAANGSLLQHEVYVSQIDRLLADPRARLALGDFYFDWFHLRDVDQMDKNVLNRKFQLFAGSDLPGPQLRGHIQDEARDMALYSTSTGENLFDLMTVNRSFARTADLAAIYGTTVWSGAGEPPTMPNDRPGLLSHAFLAATGLVSTRPIIRGFQIRTNYLCDEIPPPEPGSSNTPVDTSNRTTRQAVELITEQQGTTCRSCHLTYSNGLGFALEVFDALGRYRTEEMLFDGEKYTGYAPINVRSVPQVVIDDLREVNGPRELVNRMMESGKVETCFADNVYRFTFANAASQTGARFIPENGSEPQPSCAANALSTRAAQHSLLETFAATALLGEFRSRSFASRGTPQ